MTKQEFLTSLREGLRGLPPADIEERIAFYDEMIDDRMEEGLTEEEALAELGSVESVIAQITAETPLVKLVKEKVRRERKRSGKGLTTVLLVLGSLSGYAAFTASANQERQEKTAESVYAAQEDRAGEKAGEEAVSAEMEEERIDEEMETAD